MAISTLTMSWSVMSSALFLPVCSPSPLQNLHCRRHAARCSDRRLMAAIIDLTLTSVQTLMQVVGDRVSGLLDFEFCSFDFRAMELAVALSKYVGEDDPLVLCERFVTGYVQHGQLTAAEIKALPDLINLRIFSNAIYFTGRAIAGEDSLESLTSRAPAYARRVKWVNANRDAIQSAIEAKMAAVATA
eukprot:362866-Chlamydomonas_euryale.AAC.4